MNEINEIYYNEVALDEFLIGFLKLYFPSKTLMQWKFSKNRPTKEQIEMHSNARLTNKLFKYLHVVIKT